MLWLQWHEPHARHHFLSALVPLGKMLLIPYVTECWTSGAARGLAAEFSLWQTLNLMCYNCWLARPQPIVSIKLVLACSLTNPDMQEETILFPNAIIPRTANYSQISISGFYLVQPFISPEQYLRHCPFLYSSLTTETSLVSDKYTISQLTAWPARTHILQNDCFRNIFLKIFKKPRKHTLFFASLCVQARRKIYNVIKKGIEFLHLQLRNKKMIYHFKQSRISTPNMYLAMYNDQASTVTVSSILQFWQTYFLVQDFTKLGKSMASLELSFKTRTANSAELMQVKDPNK